MRTRLVKLNKQRQACIEQMEAVLNSSAEGALSAEQQAQFDQYKGQIEGIYKAIANERSYLDAIDKQPTAPDPATLTVEAAEVRAGVREPTTPRMEFPARRGRLMAFTGPDGDRTAYRFGQWVRAIAGKQGAQRYCRDHGIPMQMVANQADEITIGAVYNEGDNTAGGYLVLPEFDREIIRLVVEYGIFRQQCRVVPMGSDVKDRDRRTGGLTAYFVGESEAITESTGSWDQVKLVAKKLAVLTRVTNELNADAIISMADNLAWEIAYAFATKEDQCGFIGTGTSTYGGIVGVTPRLAALNGVDEGGGLILAAGNLFSEFTLAEFHRAIGILPDYAETGAAWYCHKTVWANVLQRLAVAAGGTTSEQIQTGVFRKMFLGYPVITTNTMPSTDANSQIVAILGDLRLAADLGDRAQMTLSVSDSASVGGQSVFERDQLAFRATERFDINVHDVGTATAAGPVVGIISAAS